MPPPTSVPYREPAPQTLAVAWAARVRVALQSGLSGVPSGLRGLDKLTGGWPPGHLTVVAGRPGMGVTSFLLNVLRNAAVDFGVPALYCAPAEQIARALPRLVLGEAGHATTELFAAGLSAYDHAQLPARLAPLLAAPIRVLALEAPFTPPRLLTLIRESDPLPRLLVFDYRRIFSNRGDYGASVVRDCLHELQTLAETLHIPVLLSCGVSAAADELGGYCHPKLHFLPHPDYLTQYAALVLFLYRATYYGISEDENGRPTASRAQVQIAYQRQGPSLDWVPLQFDGHTGRFRDDE